MIDVHFLSVFECYDKRLGKLVENRFTQTINLIVVGRRTIGVFHKVVLLIRFYILKSFKLAAAGTQHTAAGQYLHLKHRLINRFVGNLLCFFLAVTVRLFLRLLLYTRTRRFCSAPCLLACLGLILFIIAVIRHNGRIFILLSLGEL